MKKIKKVWGFVLGMLILFSMSANSQITFTEPEDLEDVEDAVVGENIIRSQNGTCFLRVENSAYWKEFSQLTIHYSEDGNTWRLLMDDVNLYTAQFDLTKAMFMDAYMHGVGMQLQLVETEDGYIALPGKVSNEIELENSKLYILDKNLQVQSTMFEYSTISRISYLDGMYYLERITKHYGARPLVPAKSEYLCSATLESDLNNWTKCDGMPIVNNGHVLYVKGGMAQEEWEIGSRWNKTAGVVKVYNDGQQQSEVEYEDFKISNIRTAGEYFIGQLAEENGNVRIAFSKDGIYFVTVETPFERWDKLDAAFEKPDGRLELLAGYNYRTYCNISDLEESVPQSDLYVQVKDKILGFSTPPVMEDDRTLVPMRFLFEQLGAEVEWDNDTQTATATIKPQESAEVEKAVSAKAAAQPQTISFSIDNTTAQVNGQSAVMDVPARLVNDKTMVPLRFLSEQMGYTVTWDEATNTAIVE